MHFTSEHILWVWVANNDCWTKHAFSISRDWNLCFLPLTLTTATRSMNMRSSAANQHYIWMKWNHFHNSFKKEIYNMEETFHVMFQHCQVCCGTFNNHKQFWSPGNESHDGQHNTRHLPGWSIIPVSCGHLKFHPESRILCPFTM